MTKIGRVRRFLGLRQIDVEIATGIPVRRLSAAERGVLRLNHLEESLVSSYLHDRLRIVQGVSANDRAIEVLTPEAGEGRRSSAQVLGA